MTTTQQTSTHKPHSDGGTVRIIALHFRRNRWGVGVNHRIGYRGNEWYEAVRIAPDDRYVTMSRHKTEQAARDAANVEWATMAETDRENYAEGKRLIKAALVRLGR